MKQGEERLAPLLCLRFRGRLSLGCRLFALGAFLFLGRNLVDRGRGHQVARLRDPILVLDGAVQIERLIEPGDFVVSKIGDLLVFDDAELVEALLGTRVEALDELEIVRLALWFGEAFEGLGLLLASDLLALDDASRLAAAAAQIIELGAAHPAAAYHLDRVDQRRMDREDALDALAVGDLAHGEVLVDPTTSAPDAHALIGLHARALALDHLDVDAERVAGTKIRHL